MAHPLDVAQLGNARAALAMGFARAFLQKAKARGLPLPATEHELMQWVAAGWVAGIDQSGRSAESVADDMVTAALRVRASGLPHSLTCQGCGGNGSSIEPYRADCTLRDQHPGARL